MPGSFQQEKNKCIPSIIKAFINQTTKDEFTAKHIRIPAHISQLELQNTFISCRIDTIEYEFLTLSASRC